MRDIKKLKDNSGGRKKAVVCPPSTSFSSSILHLASDTDSDSKPDSISADSSSCSGSLSDASFHHFLVRRPSKGAGAGESESSMASPLHDALAVPAEKEKKLQTETEKEMETESETRAV